MHAPVYARVPRVFGRLTNLLDEMREYVWRKALLHIAYGQAPHRAERQPKSTTRTSRYVDGKYRAAGNSKHRLDWKLSSMWHYWIEGCLAKSHTRFRTYFRVSRACFDKIYEAAAVRA